MICFRALVPVSVSSSMFSRCSIIACSISGRVSSMFLSVWVFCSCPIVIVMLFLSWLVCVGLVAVGACEWVTVFGVVPSCD